MLTKQDKEEMLADARSCSRRDSFRRARALQEARRPSLEEYCIFCESMFLLHPPKQPLQRSFDHRDFRL
ncbi:MAG: hypothetical protein HQL17_04405 [Candidatus Omnitrophica bacterium]|nr:hypothetical protein [Candidatus Omnitrophota bacterium]